MGKLDGKVIIVTGASRGIGAEIARVFAAEGGQGHLLGAHRAGGDTPLGRIPGEDHCRHSGGRW